MRRLARKSPSVYDRINIGDEDELVILGYVPNLIKCVLFWTFVLLSGGTLLLLIAWKPTVLVKATHQKCSLDCAQRLILRVSQNLKKLEESLNNLDDG